MKFLAPLLALTLLPTLALAGEPDPQIHALRTEIAALKLDRALNLNRDQARALLPLLQAQAQKAQQMKAEHERNRPALVAALTRARDELRAGGEVSPQTQAALKDARGQGMFAKGEQGSFHEQIKQILRPEQIAAVKSLHPFAGAEEMPGAGMPRQGKRFEGGFGGGEGMGEGHPGGFGRRMFLHHAMTSEAFQALVAARAR